MTVADLIRVLLELDQQCISPRPSAWGMMAEMVHTLAEHAEPSLRRGPGPDIFGDWDSVDLSPVKRRAPRELDQPTLDTIQAESAMPSPKTLVHRPGGRWDAFESDADATRFRSAWEADGWRTEAFNVSEWTFHPEEIEERPHR